MFIDCIPLKTRLNPMTQAGSIYGIGVTSAFDSGFTASVFFRQVPKLSGKLAPKTTPIWTKDANAGQPDTLGCSVFRCGEECFIPYGGGVTAIKPISNRLPTSKSTAAERIRLMRDRWGLALPDSSRNSQITGCA